MSRSLELDVLRISSNTSVVCNLVKWKVISIYPIPVQVKNRGTFESCCLLWNPTQTGLVTQFNANVKETLVFKLIGSKATTKLGNHWTS